MLLFETSHVLLFWYVLSRRIISIQFYSEIKRRDQWFHGACFMARLLWDGTTLQDTEKRSDTFWCCRLVSCSANEADIKNTLKGGNWEDAVAAPSSPTVTEVTCQGSKQSDTRRTVQGSWHEGFFLFCFFLFLFGHMPRKLFSGLYTALLSWHSLFFVFCNSNTDL